MTFPGKSVWTKLNSVFKTYVSEASNMINDVKCAECGADISDSDWRAEYDDDGDVAVWIYMCKCGTTMKVFND